MPITLCPIAIVASCEQCPAFSVCPLKTVLGDHVEQQDPPPDAPAAGPDAAPED